MIRKWLGLMLSSFICLNAHAAETLSIPAAPTINAKAYVLMDADSGAILAASNPTAHLPPASLTKLMTIYLTFQALQKGTLHLDDKVLVSKKAWTTEGSRMFIRVGTSVTVEDLLQGMIVESGNDACVAMAEHLAGSESAFAELMNLQAKALGMDNTHFTDATGLTEPDHYSSAKDLALLAQALIKQFPDQYHWFSQKWFSYNNIKQPNRNRLLWRDKFVDGLKTGYTKNAGYCLIASAKKDDMRLISVVLGASSEEARTEDSSTLLNYGFHFFKTYLLYAPHAVIKTVRVYSGTDKYTSFGVKEGLYVTLPIGQLDNIKKDIVLPSDIRAPLAKDQPVGTITVTLNGNPMVEAPLVALTDNPSGNLWRRAIDRICLSFHHFFPGKSA